MSDERELVERAKRGDRSAFESLFRDHQDDLYRFLLRLVWPQKSQAQDLAQDTFLVAFRSIGSFKGESTFRTWLLGIANNLYRDYARKARVKREGLALLSMTEIGSRGTDEIVAEDENSELIQRAFSEIAAGQKEALYLKDILGCSFDETATILGISVSAAKNRVQHGRINMVAAVRALTHAGTGKDKQDD